MEELTLITPTFLFSAVSLILLAYTNRFLSYAQLVRSLAAQPATVHTVAQIKNLRRRLYLTRAMQIMGIMSLLICVMTMFCIYIGFQITAVYLFAVALLFLIGSLALSVIEIVISVNALEVYLNGMKTSNIK